MDNTLELWLAGRLRPTRRKDDSSEVNLEEIMQPILHWSSFPKILETDNPEIHIRLKRNRDLDLTDVSEKFTPVLSSLNTLVSLYDHTQKPVQEETIEYKLDKKMIAIPVITGISTFILSTAMGFDPLTSGINSVGLGSVTVSAYACYLSRQTLKQTQKPVKKYFKSLRDYWNFHESLTDENPNTYIMKLISENAHNIGSIKFLSDDPKITLIDT